MKLVVCTKCSDVFSLSITSEKRKSCSCGKAWGFYQKDDLTATIGGEGAIPLAFHNDSFVEALRNRPEEGDGTNFKAWVIAKKCSTVEIKG